VRRAVTIAIVSLALTLSRVEDAEADPPFGIVPLGGDLLHGKPPSEHVKNWIMLILLTPRSGPSPIFLISPSTFRVDGTLATS
jgi:hypothetical protein